MADDDAAGRPAPQAERVDEGGSTRGVERRDVLKLASVIVLGSAASELEPVAAFMGGGSPEQAGGAPAGCMDGETDEKFPTSPLILYPFTDPLPIPAPLAPIPKSEVDRWLFPPGRGVGQQDSYGATHQIWPSQLYLPDPLVHRIKLQVAEHSFTTSKVQPIDKRGRPVARPGGASGPQSLPKSTIYGFNGQFPGPMVYASYGQPALVRFENHLHENPLNLDLQDFGAPDLSFLTHLHNGHTAPESDGNPAWRPHGYLPGQGPHDRGQYVDNLYLNYPAGNDEREKQSFFWFHDHRMDHTSSNVYKGMVGLYPIYDPVLDPGDETGTWQVSGAGFVRRNQPTQGLRLPGVPNGSTGRVDYDIPIVLYDCRLDDGVTPHKDFHTGCGERHREWWGKTFFLHFPNKGFVGDLFTVNGTAYPVLHVKRRKYRFRFLDASIARIYDLKLMRGKPVAAPGKQGQFQLPDGQQCMRFTEIAVDGGLLPSPIVRNSFELWPAKRREVIVDFTKYMDGSSTRKGEEIYLVNTAQMLTGRMPNAPLMEDDNDVLVPDPEFDPNYRVPILKIVIDDDKLEPDNSVIPSRLRELPVIDTRGLPHREFEFDREEIHGEIEWTVNGLEFDPLTSLAYPKRGRPEIWTITNKGLGWVHPVHLHMEEHRCLTRDGEEVVAPPGPPTIVDGKHVDDCGKEDVVSLGPGEEVTIYRNFRTFVGPYVVHCHNLAHEDHAMMFGFKILP